MIFYVQYEHMMAVLDVGFLQFLKVGSGRPQVLSSSEAARAASDTRTCQRYRHADGRYFGAQLSEGLPVAVWQPITKRARYRPFLLVGSNGAEGWQRMRSGVQPSL